MNIVTNNKPKGKRQKSVLAQLVKNFPAFVGSQKFITSCTTVCQLSLSQAILSSAHVLSSLRIRIAA